MDDPKALGYELVKQFEMHIAKFDIVGTDYRLRVQPLPDGSSYEDAVRLLYGVLDSELFCEWLCVFPDVPQPFLNV